MAYTINLQKESVKKKIAQVDKVSKELGTYSTLALLELSKLPDSLFQVLRKRIAQKGGKVYVLKKPVLQRVVEYAPVLKAYKDKITRPFALILTNLSPYELNGFFKTNSKKRAARVGEIAPFEIIVPEGETDLPPGPALSELKSAGINVQIKNGKIVIAKDSTVAKSGDVLTDPKAKALQKLGILPFSSRAQLYIASDSAYVYSPELLDLGDSIRTDLAVSLQQAVNFSLNANYPTAQTASIMLGQAIRQAIDLSLNASIYNNTTISTLLSSAVLQAMAIEGLEPKSSTKEEEKK